MKILELLKRRLEEADIFMYRISSTKKRRVFYSFHYDNDHWRAQTVRQIGTVEGSQPVSENKWETVQRSGDRAIKEWIDSELKGRSCTVVLVGSETASRKWIKYEIMKSWNDNKGVVGIYIHGLKDKNRKTSPQGRNPFSNIKFKDGRRLSSVVKCYKPIGRTSQEKYAWIKRNIAGVISQAIRIRKNTPKKINNK